MPLNRPGTVVLLLFLTGTILQLSFPGSLAAASSEEAGQWLQAHNSYRQQHGSVGLRWSARLAVRAQAYAETCSTSHSGMGYGENIAWASYDMGRAAVVKMWYDEAPLYDYGRPGFSHATGHFTQVLWKDTTEVGCGFAANCGAKGSATRYLWVCEYDPPGNYRGEFADNVLPPRSPSR